MNRVVIALAVSVLTAGSALASDKGDIMAVLKQWISGEGGTVATCADDAVQAPAPDGRRTTTLTYKGKG